MYCVYVARYSITELGNTCIEMLLPAVFTHTHATRRQSQFWSRIYIGPRLG